METLYHCTLGIFRPGNVYGVQCQKMKSTINLFFDRTKPFSISIGSDDYICIKGLLPQHLEISVSDNSFIFSAKGNATISFSGQKQEIKAGEIKKINWDFKALSGWKVTFSDPANPTNQTILEAEICAETEVLQSDSKKYLEEKYGALQKIQEGGSCLIFKTKDERILKILKPSLMTSSGIIKRFINAAKRFGAINSSYLLGFQEIIYRKYLNLAYVTTKYFAGESLENYLARKGILPLEEAKKIVISIAKNLLIFEKKGHASRSLSPNNIMVNEKGEVVLTSFLFLKSHDCSLTNTWELMITPLYTSPEQIKNATSADIMSDMFSLGMIFYALLAGQPFFKNQKEHIEYANGLRQLSSEEIHNSAPYLSSEVCEIISSLLRPDKNKRPRPQKLIEELSSLGKAPIIMEADVVNPGDSIFLEYANYDAQMPPNRGEYNVYSLQILSGPDKVYREQNWVKEETIVIGAEGDFCITSDPGIVAQHAQLEISPKECFLVDLKSPNGTIVNGKRISRMEIKSDTQFTLGNTVFLFKKTRAIIHDKELTEKDVEEMGGLIILRLSSENSDKKSEQCTSEQTSPVPEQTSPVPEQTFPVPGKTFPVPEQKLFTSEKTDIHVSKQPTATRKEKKPIFRCDKRWKIACLAFAVLLILLCLCLRSDISGVIKEAYWQDENTIFVSGNIQFPFHKAGVERPCVQIVQSNSVLESKIIEESTFQKTFKYSIEKAKQEGRNLEVRIYYKDQTVCDFMKVGYKPDTIIFSIYKASFIKSGVVEISLMAYNLSQKQLKLQLVEEGTTSVLQEARVDQEKLYNPQFVIPTFSSRKSYSLEIRKDEYLLRKIPISFEISTGKIEKTCFNAKGNAISVYGIAIYGKRNDLFIELVRKIAQGSEISEEKIVQNQEINAEKFTKGQFSLIFSLNDSIFKDWREGQYLIKLKNQQEVVDTAEVAVPQEYIKLQNWRQEKIQQTANTKKHTLKALIYELDNIALSYMELKPLESIQQKIIQWNQTLSKCQEQFKDVYRIKSLYPDILKGYEDDVELVCQYILCLKELQKELDFTTRMIYSLCFQYEILLEEQKKGATKYDLARLQESISATEHKIITNLLRYKNRFDSLFLIRMHIQKIHHTWYPQDDQYLTPNMEKMCLRIQDVLKKFPKEN